ncbi:hypothetical protein D3C80_2120700 [compost metagenome]
MCAFQHCPHFGLREPATVFQLRTVDSEVVAQNLGMTADHQRIGKRPGLARMIGNATDGEPHFLDTFAAHGGLDCFAVLDKACEA